LLGLVELPLREPERLAEHGRAPGFLPGRFHPYSRRQLPRITVGGFGKRGELASRSS